MPCYRPWKAYPAAPPASGLVWSRSRSYEGSVAVSVPCNRCIGCRLARSQEWAVRLRHESLFYTESSFLTLTFSDEHLPSDFSVNVRDTQLFLKRLRKAVGEVRYFACGEYGDELFRPHYHLIVFGCGFLADRKLWRRTPSGHFTYRSPLLEKLWPFGHSEIGSVTPQSAGYVARYAVKKVLGERAVEHYRRIHPLTGELVSVRPEFAVMSRRPGIGSRWYEQFSSDAFPSDFLIVDGRKVPVPRFYTKKLDDAEKLRVVSQRKRVAYKRAANNTPDRLAVREEVQVMRARLLKRVVE